MIYLLHHLLSMSARRFPDKIAVDATTDRINYLDLDRASDKLARVLVDTGSEGGDRIGIYLQKSIESVISIFGILKAGCVYVPIDPFAPSERMAYILADCGVRTLVSSSEIAGDRLLRLAESTSVQNVILADKTVTLDRNAFPSMQFVLWKDMLASEALERPVDRIVTDLAYILYTSGSTGEPKGVMISHLAALTFINWSHDFVSMSSNDVVSSHAPLHFDLSIFDIFATIKAGGTIALVPKEADTFPVTLTRFIAERKISVWYSVPSALIQMVTRGRFERYDYLHLRWVLFAGEVFPVKYLHRLREIVKARMANLYGPTETNVCTCFEVENLAPDRTDPLPIGKAIVNNEVFAVGEAGICKAPGEIGELYVRGPGLMSGYWSDAEKTAQVLVPNRFQKHFDEKAYRTGDFVTLDANGNYLFLGRRDNMIKRRGYRIELGEIESALYRHPDVVEAAVIAIPDEMISNRLKAFLALTREATCEEKDLLRYCHDQLPNYMVPDSIEFTDVLPKTSTGKIDRQKLSARSEK